MCKTRISSTECTHICKKNNKMARTATANKTLFYRDNVSQKSSPEIFQPLLEELIRWPPNQTIKIAAAGENLPQLCLHRNVTLESGDHRLVFQTSSNRCFIFTWFRSQAGFAPHSEGLLKKPLRVHIVLNRQKCRNRIGVGVSGCVNGATFFVPPSSPLPFSPTL